jgi:hypothetical protein
MKETIPPGHSNSSCNNQTLFNSMGKCSNNYPEMLAAAATRDFQNHFQAAPMEGQEELLSCY